MKKDAGYLMKLFHDALLDETKRHGIGLAAETLDACCRYYGLLIKWNPRVRLVGSIEPARAAVELFADSLVAARFAKPLMFVPGRSEDAGSNLSFVDIGSGGGFPGIVIKIVYPEWTATLIEAKNKKVAFLKTAARELGLGPARVVQGRAEELAGRQDMEAKFDLAFCRAVAPPTHALNAALPFLKTGGVFIAQTGDLTPEEQKAFLLTAEAGGATIERTETYKLTGGSGARRLSAVRREDSTSLRPRLTAKRE